MKLLELQNCKQLLIVILFEFNIDAFFGTNDQKGEFLEIHPITLVSFFLIHYLDK